MQCYQHRDHESRCRARRLKFGNSDGANLVGTIEVPANILADVLGAPTLKLKFFRTDSEQPVLNLRPAPGGFTFETPPVRGLLQADVRLTIACAGMQRALLSTTILEECYGIGTVEWASSGEVCKDCRIIAEMAPTPIVSDNLGDDLPLGRVVQLRVVELARAGKQVLLFAENDAGSGAAYTWNVSGGAIDKVAEDVVVWTLPEEQELTPYGQVAVHTSAGAAVENFLWGVS
jgi:hypothetical protein